MASRLFREHELAFRTQYAELKERTLAAGTLLPGTPGSLKLKEINGSRYWYRVSYSVPGKAREELVCKEGDEAALEAAKERIEFSNWVAGQVSIMRKLGFQVADKAVARVVVELHNQGAFSAGLVLVGTLAYMAWLNELGAIAVSARTQDIDLARRQPLKLGAPISFLETMQATGLPFVAVPGLPSSSPSTSVKLPGVQGLRIDVLAPGKSLGAPVAIPELKWCAQAVPYYDYLLADAEPAAMLAGGHCVPVCLPQAARMVWHKLYASTQRKGFPEKAAKDRQQALVLGALLAEQDGQTLVSAFSEAPKAMKTPLKSLRNALISSGKAHPELADLLADCLG
ncbi:MAG TPA: GSU2403 family nucleotidyltransferase fold protein [Rhodocyclaceae bacterium]|nr:GSU2403 family nucleotidyltransferase fold protein [Rhodocyclaceae bacterium]